MTIGSRMLLISGARSVDSTRLMFLFVRFYFFLLRADFTLWLFVLDLAKRTAHPNLVFFVYLLVRLALFQVLFSLGLLLMDELWPAVNQFLPGGGESSPPTGGFNPLPGPSGPSENSFFGAAVVNQPEIDQLPSPGYIGPDSLEEIWNFMENEEEVEQPTAPDPEPAPAPELEPLISDIQREEGIRRREVEYSVYKGTLFVPPIERVKRIAQLEKQIERALRRDFSDDSVLQNYERWRDISVKNHAVTHYMRDYSLKKALNCHDVRESGPFKRIIAAIKKKSLLFERR